MKTGTDVTSTDRAAAAQRAASAIPARATLNSARTELFARTFAVWRLRADGGQGESASANLGAPTDAAAQDAHAARDADARAADAREAASADGTRRAWRELVEQVAVGPASGDVTAAFGTRARPVADRRGDAMRETERAARDEKDAAATRRREIMEADDTQRPLRDVTALDPAMRDRLERVMSRMAEAGHTVTITETARSQGRQDALYAQGRTTSGPIVTWTRQSRHLDGLAVDVQVDGTFQNHDGYALLGKIAAEEGLATLGARDPGHLELRADDALATLGQMATITDAQIVVEAGEARTARATQVAQVAQVASVARVAQVARVADVAPTASSMSAADAKSAAPTPVDAPHLAHANASAAGPATSAAPVTHAAIMNQRPGAPSPQALAVAAAFAASARGAVTSEGAFSERGAGEQGSNTARARALAGLGASGGASARGTVSAMTSNALAGALGAAGAATSHGGVATQAVRGAATAMRAEEIQSLIESRDRQPVSRMMLTVDDDAGGIDRIRVDVRGARVGAQMMFGASGDAAQAAGRVMELARALEQRGLAPDALTVANAAAGSATELTRAAAPASERGGSTAPRQDDPSRTPQDQNRHRSRKEQGEPR